MIKTCATSKKGFTLIELMVAISIVAVLATIGYAIFNGTQRSARDSKRRGDVAAIGNAYEAHYLPIPGLCEGQTANTTQPTYCPLMQGWFTSQHIPLDPLGSARRVYCMTTNNTGTAIADISAQALADWAAAPTQCPQGWAPVVDQAGANPIWQGGAQPFNTWKVCSLLEAQTAAVCVGSTQL